MSLIFFVLTPCAAAAFLLAVLFTKIIKTYVYRESGREKERCVLFVYPVYLEALRVTSCVLSKNCLPRQSAPISSKNCANIRKVCLAEQNGEHSACGVPMEVKTKPTAMWCYLARQHHQRDNPTVPINLN